MKDVGGSVCDTVWEIYIVQNISASSYYDAGTCLMSAHFVRQFI